MSGFESSSSWPGELPRDGIDLLHLALELQSCPSRERAVDAALEILASTPGVEHWAILERRDETGYRAVGSNGVSRADVRALADLACGRLMQLEVHADRGAARLAHGPHWEAVLRDGDLPATPPTVVLGCWTEDPCRVLDESDLHFAAKLVVGAVEQARIIESLTDQTSRDSLTGLLNRRGVLDAVRREDERARRYGGTYAVLFVDLDEFKQVNDQRGHSAGDRVLETVGRFFASSIRRSDEAGRIGGDEFLLLLPGTGLEAASKLGRRLVRALARRPILIEGEALTVSATFGASSFEEGGDVEALLGRADHRMLSKKRRRRPMRRVPDAIPDGLFPGAGWFRRV